MAEQEHLHRGRPATKWDVAKAWLRHPRQRWQNRHHIRAIKRYLKEQRDA
jgi:hypothetical protein